jgi:hypothetical protein
MSQAQAVVKAPQGRGNLVRTIFVGCRTRRRTARPSPFTPADASSRSQSARIETRRDPRGEFESIEGRIG